MKNKHLSTCFGLEKKYHLGNMHITVRIKKNPLSLSPDTLFSMAERINRKRGFLFVSHVLGKHIPVYPAIPQLAGASLALLLLETYYQRPQNLADVFRLGFTHPEKSAGIVHKLENKPFDLPEPMLFIGFAETATALGHAMFASFANNAYYIHTTREEVIGLPSCFQFEEQHSHATTHRCYPQDDTLLAKPYPIVLVDDEMTTGKTSLNLIRSIQQRFPRTTYIVTSLLDWRSEADRAQFAEVEKELGVEIKTFSLMSGSIHIEGTANPDETRPKAVSSKVHPIQIKKHYLDEFTTLPSFFSKNPTPYIEATGRFGLARDRWEEIKSQIAEAGHRLKQTRRGTRTLCMGTGEFMYVPFQIASYMGTGVYVQSTTRSPIQPKKKPHYAIQNGWEFASPDDPEVRNFMYNIPKNAYDEIYLFLERDTPLERLTPLYQAIADTGIQWIHQVICSRRRKERKDFQ